METYGNILQCMVTDVFCMAMHCNVWQQNGNGMVMDCNVMLCNWWKYKSIDTSSNPKKIDKLADMCFFSYVFGSQKVWCLHTRVALGSTIVPGAIGKERQKQQPQALHLSPVDGGHDLTRSWLPLDRKKHISRNIYSIIIYSMVDVLYIEYTIVYIIWNIYIMRYIYIIWLYI